MAACVAAVRERDEALLKRRSEEEMAPCVAAVRERCWLLWS